MSDASAFTPSGPTVLVDSTAMRQVASPLNPVQAKSYRVSNKGTSLAYIGWVPVLPGVSTAPALITVSAPTAGVPSANTLGIQGSSVEVFTLPQNAWFCASSGATFEITPGEGY